MQSSDVELEVPHSPEDQSGSQAVVKKGHWTERKSGAKENGQTGAMPW